MTERLMNALAPTGVLRASINTGNPILAHAFGDSAAGVSVDLARELAQRLGVEAELHVFSKAAQSVAAIEVGEADIGFFAIDPKRGEHIAFTAPYVLIEGAYLVAHDSPLQFNAEVDRRGHRVIVGQGSAYDLFLTRTLKNAEIVRASNSQMVIPVFDELQAEVAAGVRQQLIADTETRTDIRLLPGRFMVIEQAMGLQKSRGVKPWA